MTSLKCQRCGHFWSIHTLWPDKLQITGRFCPDCIGAVLPTIALPILGIRRTA